MSSSSKTVGWREYTLRNNKELYSEFMNRDFQSLEKEIVSIADEMVDASKKFLHEFDEYTSGDTDLEACALWFVETYEKYTAMFSRNYTLDVHILGNPTEGPVAKASRNLEKIMTDATKDRIQAGYIVRDMLNNPEKRISLVREYIDDDNADELYDNLKILLRSQELEEINNEMARKYFYKCIDILYSGIKMYTEYFFKTELEWNLDACDEAARRLKEKITEDM